MLAQTYYDVVARYGDSVNLLYFSLDEAIELVGANLNAILNEYESLLGETYEAQNKPTIILIDEVQADPNWAAVLKSLNDRSKRVFLACSGSSAVHIQASADISGRRASVEKLYPLSFCEYEMLARDIYPSSNPSLKQAVKDALYSSTSASEVYKNLKTLEVRVNQYWARADKRHVRHYLAAGSLPFALAERTLPDVYDAVLATVDKVVSRDIQELGKFDADTVLAVKRLLFILAESDAISNIKLSRVLGISHITIATVLDALVQAELLVRVMPQGSALNASKKPSKFLFMSPTIRAAFFSVAGSQGTSMTREGRLLEDVAGLHLYREFASKGAGSITYDSAEGGADFILKIGARRQIAIEVGRGDKTSRQVVTTMQRVKCDYGLSVSDGPLQLLAQNTVVAVPLDYFLMM
ncbi:ATP-binding protein [bacterium]|nr:MAG: ATP-binding protein [bacterium]